MTTMLLDSTILIAHLRGHEPATEFLLSLTIAERMVSVLSRVEVEGGMRSGERADVARLFGAVTLVPVSDSIAAEAGRMLRRYRRSHQGIDLVDYVIAASARVRQSQIATLNIKHFPMFPGLSAPF